MNKQSSDVAKDRILLSQVGNILEGFNQLSNISNGSAITSGSQDTSMHNIFPGLELDIDDVRVREHENDLGRQGVGLDQGAEVDAQVASLSHLPLEQYIRTSMDITAGSTEMKSHEDEVGEVESHADVSPAIPPNKNSADLVHGNQSPTTGKTNNKFSPRLSGSSKSIGNRSGNISGSRSAAPTPSQRTPKHATVSNSTHGNTTATANNNSHMQTIPSPITAANTTANITHLSHIHNDTHNITYNSLRTINTQNTTSDSRLTIFRSPAHRQSSTNKNIYNHYKCAWMPVTKAMNPKPNKYDIQHQDTSVLQFYRKMNTMLYHT